LSDSALLGPAVAPAVSLNVTLTAVKLFAATVTTPTPDWAELPWIVTPPLPPSSVMNSLPAGTVTVSLYVPGAIWMSYGVTFPAGTALIAAEMVWKLVDDAGRAGFTVQTTVPVTATVTPAEALRVPAVAVTVARASAIGAV
jgi:hypothetical protein